MASSLLFPNGVRLAHRDELPGPEPDRARAWARIQGAEIQPGFVVSASADPRFDFYGEANVDAHKIWSVFSSLCEQLLGPSATLLMGEIDDDPESVGMNKVPLILRCLEPHSYQLTHDGFLQFGLVCKEGSRISEVFVSPTKHFQVWLGDVNILRTIMQQHGVLEAEALQFIDEYPRTTTQLSAEKRSFETPKEMILHMKQVLAQTWHA